MSFADKIHSLWQSAEASFDAAEDTYRSFPYSQERHEAYSKVAFMRNLIRAIHDASFTLSEHEITTMLASVGEQISTLTTEVIAPTLEYQEEPKLDKDIAGDPDSWSQYYSVVPNPDANPLIEPTQAAEDFVDAMFEKPKVFRWELVEGDKPLMATSFIFSTVQEALDDFRNTPAGLGNVDINKVFVLVFHISGEVVHREPW